MKGKLPIIVTAIIAFAMVLSLVAAVTPATVAAEIPSDVITAVNMPTQNRGNLAIDSSIECLAQAIDGTMFAGVEDESGYRWQIKAGTEGEQDRYYAVFFSKNGGYDWTQGFIIPWDDTTPIVEIVPVPDYSANNSIVYMATELYVYISSNGGKTFSRTDAVVPYVSLETGNSITSLDVAANINGGGYVCVVGTDGTNGGVFTYNEGGYADWRDKQINNDTAAAENDYSVYDVKFSTRYTADKDKVILAVYSNGDYTNLTVRGTLGTWGVEALDAIICRGSIDAARIALPADYHWINSPRSFVAIRGNGSVDDAYRITSIQSPGNPSVKRLNVMGGDSIYVYDIAVSGTGSSVTALATIEDPTFGDLQVYRSTNVAGFSPTWQPSHKPPVGDVPGWLVWTTATPFVASEFDGDTLSGVSVLEEGALGMAWNGVGLLDTVVASGDYLDSSEDSNTADLIAGPVWVEASPNNKVDNTIYMVTYDEDWNYAMYMWRTANGGNTWDLVLTEDLPMPESNGYVEDGEGSFTAYEAFDPEDWWTGGDLWSIRTVPNFNNSKGSDQTMFLLGYSSAKSADWLYKSTDAGTTWKPFIAMPNFEGSSGYEHTAWCVVNANTVLLSDDYGYVYKTTDNGFSWTEGAPTAYDAYTTNLKVYNDSTLGLVVLAGVYTYSDEACEAWISLDGGVTFSQIGTALAYVPVWNDIAPVMVDFDNNFNTNRMVYAAFGGQFDVWMYTKDGDGGWVKTEQDDAGVWRSKVVTADTASSLWTEIVSTEDFMADVPAITTYAEDDEKIDKDRSWRYLWPTALEVGPENTIYVPFIFADYKETYSGDYDPDMRYTWGGFVRCLDGTAADTQWSFVDESMPRYGGLWLASVVSGSQTMYTIGTRLDEWGYNIGDTDAPLVDTRLLVYRDTLGSKAGGMVPASGAKNVGTISGGKANVALTWGNISGTKYEWQVALDSNFDSIAASGNASAGKSSAIASGLELGTTYYWRVRATEPTAGPWSSTVSFTTINTVSGAPTLISPANGVSTSDTKPLFTWTAVTGATSYKIQVATDSGYSSLIIDKAVTSPVYAATEELSENVYYWRVTATVGSDTTAPGTGAFEISSTADGGDSSTPAWVWVLIALGIVLAIFVLVLILRTRRPV